MFDTVMMIAFVLFMIFLIRGFMLQSSQKHRDKLNQDKSR